MIMKCTCKHSQQDEMHGHGMRVHNQCAGKTNIKYRCTVCGSEKEASANTKPQLKKVSGG